MSNLFYSLCYNTILLFLLLLRLLQLWPLEILQVHPLSFRRTLSFCEHVLTFWHCKVLQDHLVFSLPRLVTSHFCKERRFIF